MAEPDAPPGAADAVLLAPLTEDSFVHNLHVRYKRDIIYTYVGDALVSLNPCRPLPLYSAELVRAYLARPPHALPPHLYAIAATAYRWVRDRNESQCIVITGESGAGKTEAARVCLQCAVVAGGAGGALTAAGTLLEAFGNAATARNHNASRFGKLLEIEFDFKGEPVGGHITHCVKSDAVVLPPGPGILNLRRHLAVGELCACGQLHGVGTSSSPLSTANSSARIAVFRLDGTGRARGAAAGERNFHVLYQLLAGADVALLKRLRLQRSWERYRALRPGAHPPHVPHLAPAAPAAPADQDREHFTFTMAAMRTLGLGGAQRDAVLRLLAFVLKLANVEFEPQHNVDGTIGARLQHCYELTEACALVGVDAEALGAALGAAAPELDAPLDESPDGSEAGGAGEARLWGEADEGGQADEGGEAREWAAALRDRLVCALYGRLFTWLVNAVNAHIKPAEAGRRRSLGILDVYGFECLARNGLERLLINYAAERVQAAVTGATLRREQELYAAEGLAWRALPYADHELHAELWDAGPESLLGALQDEARARGPGAEADALVARLARLARARPPRLQALPPTRFRVLHFGGAVVYEARGMLAAERDAVCRRCGAALAAAREPLLAALFAPPRAARAGGSPRRPASLASRQRALVGALVRRLGAPRLVRCLRNDAAMRPRSFDASLVRHQLREQGIMDLTLLRRDGWCDSMSARALLARYALLRPPGAAPAPGPPPGSPRAVDAAVVAARALLRRLPVPSAEFAFGRTRVFIRSPRTVWELEALRAARVERLVVRAQRAWRAHRARRAAACIVRAWRAHRARAEAGAPPVSPRAPGAAARLWRWWCTCARRRYLAQLWRRLPVRHASPACAAWPACPAPRLLGGTDALLRRLHHAWRCRLYRAAFDQTARNRMREKVTASVLFKERKLSYARSVAHPFVGDYVRLRASAAWRRAAGAGADRYVVFADVVGKVARSSGRVARCLAVLSTAALLLLEPRSLRVRRRVPAQLVYRLSLSPHADDLLVVHLRASGGPEDPAEELAQWAPRDAGDAPGCLFGGEAARRRRGDVVLRTCHVLELATKLFLVVQNAAGAPPAVAVASEFEANFGGQLVTVSFHAVGGEGGARLLRRGSRMDVLV